MRWSDPTLINDPLSFSILFASLLADHQTLMLTLKLEAAPASFLLQLEVINLLKVLPQCNFVVWMCLWEMKHLFQQLCWIWGWQPQKSNTWNLCLMKLMLTFRASVKSPSALLIDTLTFCWLSNGLRKKQKISFSCESLSVDYVGLTRNKQLLALFHCVVSGLNAFWINDASWCSCSSTLQ